MKKTLMALYLLKGYRISALVTRLDGAKSAKQGAKTIKHGIALFPGYPGILKLHEENGQPQYEMRGNFLVRARRHWLDQETLAAVIDAPSDEWTNFSQVSAPRPATAKTCRFSWTRSDASTALRRGPLLARAKARSARFMPPA
jgi:hypothetical protein